MMMSVLYASIREIIFASRFFVRMCKIVMFVLLDMLYTR